MAKKKATKKAVKPGKSGKAADLAGPGISTYAAVDKILPRNYRPILNNKDTQKAIFAIKRYIEDGLAKALKLQLVQVPLIVEKESGMNDNLDRDGSRTPVEFPCGLGHRPAHERAGRAGGDEVEALGADPVRLQGRRGHQHRHARGAQGLLPRPRPQRPTSTSGTGSA